MYINRHLSPHSTRVERWLGAELAEGFARNTRGWYGDPLRIAGCYGLGVTGGGDYVGAFQSGAFASMADYMTDKAKRILRRTLHRSQSTCGAGFSSLSDLISEVTVNGKQQTLRFNKTGVAAPAVSATQPMWANATLPPAGSNAAAAPGGTTPDRTSTGAMTFTNPTGGDTTHITTITLTGGAAGGMLLYDYYFGVNNSLNATNTAVTGVSSRYQDTTAANTFCSMRVTTVLSATATNFTLTYVDDNGNAAEAAAAVTGRVSAAVQTMPFTAPAWFIPLNSGDHGVRAIKNVQSSGANTGVADWFLGKPIVIVPCTAANVPFIFDGINSAFGLQKIVDSACLAWLEYFKTSTGLQTYDGTVLLAQG